MAEEFGFQKSVRNRGRIHGQERTIADGASLVYRARDQFLSRPALPLNEDRHCGRGRLFGQLKNGAHMGILGDEDLSVIGRHFHAADLLLHQGLLPVAANRKSNLLVIKRLGDEVHRAPLQG